MNEASMPEMECKIEGVGDMVLVDCPDEEPKLCYTSTGGYNVEGKAMGSGGGYGRTKTKIDCDRVGDLPDR